MTQLRVENVRPGMRIGLTQVVTEVEPTGRDDYRLVTRLIDTEDLGIPPIERTYPSGTLISIEDGRRS
ncbi:hypothetical protein ACFWP7_28865 [Streptomyces sp. NPDC058470]|uniref:hypothetical protein n=1 Tax=Streptomyces sp. NPDC058470 TaxID=3346515 RepID=UPI003665D462